MRKTKERKGEGERKKRGGKEVGKKERGGRGENKEQLW